MIKAIDFSFSAGAIKPEWCADKIAQGYDLAIGNLWTGNKSIEHTERALRHWREAGGRIAGYIAIHSGTPIDVHVARGKETAGDEWANLQFVAIDVEDVGAGLDPVTAGDVLYAANLVSIQGQVPVVYTSWNYWHNEMKNPKECQHLPLWDASHGLEPSPEMNRLYGGWGPYRVGHQHTNTTDFDGILVDFNVFDGDWLDSLRGVVTPQPEPTPESQGDQPSLLAIALAHLQAAEENLDAGNPDEVRQHIGWARDLIIKHAQDGN